MKNLIMMRKMVFMLLFAVIGAASVNAQVTIGKNAPAHDGAVLDLSQGEKEMGLLLPHIDLKDVDVLQVADASASKIDALKASATGMFVYNTSATAKGGNGIGLYVWDGKRWCAIAVDGTDPAAMIPEIDWVQSYTTADDALNYTFSVRSTGLAEPTSYKWTSKSDDAVTVTPDLNTIKESTAELKFSGTGSITLSVTPENSYGEGDPVSVTITVSKGIKPEITWNQSIDAVNTATPYIYSVKSTGTSTPTSYKWAFTNVMGDAKVTTDLSTITGNTAELKFSGSGVIMLMVIPSHGSVKGDPATAVITVTP